MIDNYKQIISKYMEEVKASTQNRINIHARGRITQCIQYYLINANHSVHNKQIVSNYIEQYLYKYIHLIHTPDKINPIEHSLLIDLIQLLPIDDHDKLYRKASFIYSIYQSVNENIKQTTSSGMI